jgi:plasmid stability protein
MRTPPLRRTSPDWFSNPMPNVQIRDFPESAYKILKSRAREHRQSLQSYLRDVLINLALTPSKAKVLTAIGASLADHGGVLVDRNELRGARDDGRR